MRSQTVKTVVLGTIFAVTSLLVTEIASARLTRAQQVVCDDAKGRVLQAQGNVAIARATLFGSAALSTRQHQESMQLLNNLSALEGVLVGETTQCLAACGLESVQADCGVVQTGDVNQPVMFENQPALRNTYSISYNYDRRTLESVNEGTISSGYQGVSSALGRIISVDRVTVSRSELDGSGGHSVRPMDDVEIRQFRGFFMPGSIRDVLQLPNRTVFNFEIERQGAEVNRFGVREDAKVEWQLEVIVPFN